MHKEERKANNRNTGLTVYIVYKFSKQQQN